MTKRPSSAEPAQRRLLFGLSFDALDMDGVVARCRCAIERREPVLIGMLNAAKVVKLRQSPPLRNALLRCDLLLADGQSVVWTSRLLRAALPERVAGIDILERLLAVAEAEGRSVYLLGARPAVLARLEEALARRYPALAIAGRQHGYFTAAQEAEIVETIRGSGADMLFVGMTTPRKEIFLSTYRDRLGVPVMHGVGGAFDVLAGITRRAPESWQRLGLEWFYRVVQEPRRMWRRYLVTNTLFVALTARELVSRSPILARAPATGNEPGSRADMGWS